MTEDAVDRSGLQHRSRPVIDRDTAFFWEGCREGELRIQRCTNCGTLRNPPLPGCRHCHSLAWDYVVACGRATVHTFTVHHHPPVPGFRAPFVIAVVRLDEGPRMVSNIVDAASDELRLGDGLELVFTPLPDGLSLPTFRPRASQAARGVEHQ